MRITTNAILRNYKTNLNTAMENLDTARNQAMTQRKYAYTSEDPSSAAKAYQLRRSYMKNETYLDSLKDMQSQLETTSSSILQVSSLANTLKGNYLEGITDTMSIDERKTIALSLREAQKSVVLSMNSQYNDKYLFGGAATTKAPFELIDNKLYYRGLDVSDPANAAKLDDLADEKLYADLGFGITTNAGGDIVGSSVYDMSFPGVNVLGYGKNADGVEENFVNLLGQMADELEKDPVDHDFFVKLMDQFDESHSQIIDSATQLGSKSQFLENTYNRLDENRINLNEQIIDVELIDQAEALTNYAWAQYAYNAALKIGTSILSPSFIDFMTN